MKHARPDLRSSEWGWRAVGKQWTFHFSKAVTNLLRHDHYGEVVKRGLMDSLGWVKCQDVLKAPTVRRFGADVSDLDRIISENGKQRLERCDEHGEQYFRVVQGHSITGVNLDTMMDKFTPDHAEWIPCGYHGTGVSHIQSFVEHGLDASFNKFARSREHVHMARSLSGVKEGREVAGMRGGSTTIVVVDLESLHEARIPIFCYLSAALRAPRNSLSGSLTCIREHNCGQWRRSWRLRLLSQRSSGGRWKRSSKTLSGGRSRNAKRSRRRSRKRHG